MLIQSPTPAALLFLAALFTLAAGCKTDSDGSEPTVTGQAQATATAEPPTSDIRQEVLADQPGLREFLATVGGEAETSRIFYADLTGSGRDEAVFPISSGGESGDIAVFVFGYGDEGVAELLRLIPSETGIVATTENGQLKTTEGVYAPDDPFGFPSQLLHRYYSWDGSALVIDREEQEPAS